MMAYRQLAHVVANTRTMLMITMIWIAVKFQLTRKESGAIYNKKVKWCGRTISLQTAKNSCTSDRKAEQGLGANTVYRVCPYRGPGIGLFRCSA
jgi:hypothetical protein